jgi:hypothetical protein
MFGYELKPSLITVEIDNMYKRFQQGSMLLNGRPTWMLRSLVHSRPSALLVDLGSDCRSQPPRERRACGPWQDEWSV